MARFTGLFIGASFGTLFVLINAGSPLPTAVAIGLKILAVLALVSLVGAAGVISRSGPGDGVRMDQFGRGYRIVVLAEVVLLFGGFQVLRLLDAPEQSRIAWVAVVVGVHFIAFLWVWRQRSILVPGVLLTVYGVAGLVMAPTSAAEWVPIVSGVLSGVTLLACCLAVMSWEYRNGHHVVEQRSSGRH